MCWSSYSSLVFTKYFTTVVRKMSQLESLTTGGDILRPDVYVLIQFRSAYCYQRELSFPKDGFKVKRSKCICHEYVKRPVEGPDKIQHTADVGTISVGWHLCDLVVGPFSQSPGWMSYNPMTRKVPVVACIICLTLTHCSVAQSPKLVVLVVKSAVRPTYCNSDARYPGKEVTRPAA